MNHEVRVEVNFTVSHAAEPLLNATAVSCGLSRVVADNHARDAVLQAELAELQAVRGKLAKTEEAVAWWTRQVQRLPATAFFPRPPPPPLLGAAPPPAPPKDPSFPARIAALQGAGRLATRARARARCARGRLRPERERHVRPLDGRGARPVALLGQRALRGARGAGDARGLPLRLLGQPQPGCGRARRVRGALGRRSVVLRRGPGDAAQVLARGRPDGALGRLRAASAPPANEPRPPSRTPSIFGRNGSVQIERTRTRTSSARARPTSRPTGRRSSRAPSSRTGTAAATSSRARSACPRACCPGSRRRSASCAAFGRSSVGQQYCQARASPPRPAAPR